MPEISHKRTIFRWKVTFIFSLLFAVPTFIVALVPVDWHVVIPGLTVRDVILFFLSTVIQVGVVRGVVKDVGGEVGVVLVLSCCVPHRLLGGTSFTCRLTSLSSMEPLIWMY